MTLARETNGVLKAELRQQRLDRDIQEWVSDGNKYDLKPENVRIPGLPMVNFVAERRLNDHLRDLGKKRHRTGLFYDNDHNRFLEKQLNKPELRKRFVANLIEQRDVKMLTKISVSVDISRDLEDYRIRTLRRLDTISMRENTRSVTQKQTEVFAGKTINLSQVRPFTHSQDIGTQTRAGRTSPTNDILPEVIKERTMLNFSTKKAHKFPVSLPSITSNPRFGSLEKNLCRNYGQILERPVTCIVQNVDALHMPPQTQRTSKREIGNRIRDYLVKVGLVKRTSALKTQTR